MTWTAIFAFALFPIIIGAIAATAYSWWKGTSWFWSLASGIGGGTLGGITQSFSKVGYVIQAGLTHIGDPSYLGMTLFTFVLILMAIVLIFVNLLPTVSTRPHLIR